MVLGPQCWSCRHRRTKCTSESPSCSNCLKRDIECPGYSSTKPLRWKPGHKRPKSSVSSTSKCPTLRDNHSDYSQWHIWSDRFRFEDFSILAPFLTNALVFSSRDLTIARSVQYCKWAELRNTKICSNINLNIDNEFIAPDLVPVHSSYNPFRQSPNEWTQELLRDNLLQVCIAETHKQWKQLQVAFENTSYDDRAIYPSADSLVPAPGTTYLLCQSETLQLMQLAIKDASPDQYPYLLKSTTKLVACQVSEWLMFEIS